MWPKNTLRCEWLNLHSLESEFNGSGKKEPRPWMGRKIKQGACVCSLVCLTLCDPMDCSPPGSSVHGTLQERILKWVTVSSSRGSSDPVDSLPLNYRESLQRGRREQKGKTREWPANWLHFLLVTFKVRWKMLTVSGTQQALNVNYSYLQLRQVQDGACHFGGEPTGSLLWSYIVSCS